MNALEIKCSIWKKILETKWKMFNSNIRPHKFKEDFHSYKVITTVITDCYSLDLECPPKAHVLKAWPPIHDIIGRWWNFRKWSLVGGHWAHELEEDIRTAAPPLPFSLASNWDEVTASPPIHSFFDLLLTPNPKAMRSSDHVLKPLKAWAKINLSFYKLMVSSILSQWWEID
jgi:hypothetical protein